MTESDAVQAFTFISISIYISIPESSAKAGPRRVQYSRLTPELYSPGRVVLLDLRFKNYDCLLRHRKEAQDNSASHCTIQPYNPSSKK